MQQNTGGNVECVFHNPVMNNKCDPNRKQRMMIFKAIEVCNKEVMYRYYVKECHSCYHPIEASV